MFIRFLQTSLASLPHTPVPLHRRNRKNNFHRTTWKLSLRPLVFWITTFPAFAGPFTIEPIKGNLNAMWSGDAGAIVAGAPTKAPSLRQLGFGHWPTEPDPNLTMAGVGHYSKMMKLESLQPGQLRPADGSIADFIPTLSKVPSLKSMRLQMNSKMNLENRGHPKDLFAAQLSDLVPFAEFPALTTLILNGVIIPEGGLASCAKISSLKTLRLQNSNVPESEVTALKKCVRS